ncbi:hypothetical protein ACHAXA_004702 [Cyclostephanos tholiformis]|uniref:Uncharacterized protein n=1 Tax=Cyclostephanos tholiformis TaxID=382380 RepID=A0ABD3SSN0_9STRA
MHLVSTTRIINSTISTLSSSSSTSSPMALDLTLLLLMVRSLQRGFLRGHDAFTTTSLGALLMYLDKTKGIGRRMGCWTCVRGVYEILDRYDNVGHGARVRSASTAPGGRRRRIDDD